MQDQKCICYENAITYLIVSWKIYEIISTNMEAASHKLFNNYLNKTIVPWIK